MTVSVPRLAVAALVICAVLLATVFVARQVNQSTSARCTPQGGCVDQLERPYVMRRGS